MGKRFVVEAWENERLFGRREGPVLFHARADALWAVAQPHRLVAVFVVEATSAYDAAEQVFHIGNSPENPADTLGAVWPHDKVRSMSAGDSVLVHEVGSQYVQGWTCMSMGFDEIDPGTLNTTDAA